MKNIDINEFVKRCEADFISYLGIDSFPRYRVVAKEMSLKTSQKQGFDSTAAAFYDVSTGSHTLEIWTDLCISKMNAEYLVFHELTHIYDAEKYSERDKIKHVANKGFTEYHAAQNDFMQLLGAKKESEQLSFSVQQEVDTISGKMSAFKFVMMPHDHAIKMIKRIDFPANIEALAVTFGLIFNYYGRRSICKMYATDFEDKADNTIIAKFIHEDTVKALDTFMLGWFDQGRVAKIDELYYKMAISLAQQHKL